MKNETSALFTGGQDTLLLIKAHEAITFSDIRKHLAGPSVALVFHVILLVIVFNVSMGSERAAEEKNVTVTMRETEEVIPPEQQEPEKPDPPEMDVPDQTDIFTVTEMSAVTFQDEMPSGEVEDVVSPDSVNDLDVIPSPVVINISNSPHILKDSGPFGAPGGGGGDGDGEGGIPGNMLQGVFYDLKQYRNREPSGAAGNVTKVMHEFVKSDWVKKRASDGTVSYPMLDVFYKATRRLWNSCFYIPLMAAENAPAAYGCAESVKTGGWVAVYSGRVLAPVSGRIRFVGGADDVIVVRFNREVVLDYGYFSFTLGGGIDRNAITRSASASAEAVARVEKLSPYSDAVEIHTFANSPANGFASGKIIEVEEGAAYDIEIVISEIPGGVFHGSLFVEYMDEDQSLNERDSRGNTLLPLFSTNGALPEMDSKYVRYSRDPRRWVTVPENYKSPKKKKDVAKGEEDILTI